MYGDEEEDDDEDEATPAFQITFDEQGRAVSGRQLSVTSLLSLGTGHAELVLLHTSLLLKVASSLHAGSQQGGRIWG